MSFMESTVSSAKELWELAVDKTAETVEVNKLRYAIVKKKNNMKKLFQTIGRKQYIAYKHPERSEDLTTYYDQLDLLADDIRDLQQELADLQNKNDVETL